MAEQFFTAAQVRVLTDNTRMIHDQGLHEIWQNQVETVVAAARRDNGYETVETELFAFRTRFVSAWVELGLQAIDVSRVGNSRPYLSLAAIDLELSAYPSSGIRFNHIRLAVSRLALQTEAGLWQYNDVMARPILEAFTERLQTST